MFTLYCIIAGWTGCGILSWFMQVAYFTRDGSEANSKLYLFATVCSFLGLINLGIALSYLPESLPHFLKRKELPSMKAVD